MSARETVRELRDRRDGLSFRWLVLGNGQNRATRRAAGVADRAVRGVRWNKGGDAWRVNAQALGSRRARREGR